MEGEAGGLAWMVLFLADMKQTWIAGILLGWLLAGCGGERDVAFAGHPIINGSPDTSEAHMGVVGLFFGGGACTGTLIARDVVLTAGHCVYGQRASSYTVTFGYDMNDPDHTRGVQETWVHPGYSNSSIANDIALLRLSSGAPAGIAPIPHLPASLEVTQADVGTPLEFVGFGRTETGSSGVKLHATNALNWVCTSSGGCSISGGWANQNTLCQDQNPSGICFGDSGGPALIERNGIQYVAGVASYVANDWCSGYGCHTKVDAYDADIGDFVGGVAGAFCSGGWQCLSGHCVDGVCCRTECPGVCASCNLPGAAGTCTTVSDGTPCPDADACDGRKTCQGGQCVTGAPPDCDDANVCTADGCDPATGCVHDPVADGLSCSDGDVCNGRETCSAGMCRPGSPLDCDDDNPCTGDACDPVAGCSHETLADGTACGGGPCGPASCRAGRCQLDDPAFCEDEDPCTDNSCDPELGCLYNPTPDGTPCPDGNPCNGEELCSAGLCLAGSPLDCDDRNRCTRDTCDPAAGCVHRAEPDGTVCGGGVCGEAACQGGACLVDGRPVCNDHNPCTRDWCDQHGSCLNQPVSDGTSCGPCGTCRTGACDYDLDCVVIEGGCGCAAADPGPVLAFLPALLWLGVRRRRR